MKLSDFDFSDKLLAISDIFYRKLEEEQLIEFLGVKTEYLPFFISLLKARLQLENKKIIVVFPNFKEAKEFYLELSEIYPQELIFFLPTDDFLKKKVKLSPKFRSLGKQILSDKEKILVTGAPIFLNKFFKKEVVFSFKEKEIIELEDFIKKLVIAGFSEYEEGKEKLYQYRVLGEVVDLYLPDEKSIIRVDFFDDEIELICRVNPETGEIEEKLSDYYIYKENMGSSYDFLDYLIESNWDDLVFWFDNPRLIRDSCEMYLEDLKEEGKEVSFSFDELVDNILSYEFTLFLSSSFSSGLLGGMERRPLAVKLDIRPLKFPLKTGLVLEFFKKEMLEKIEKRYLNFLLINEEKTYITLKNYLSENKISFSLDTSFKLKGGPLQILSQLISGESFFIQDYGINVICEKDLKGIFNLDEENEKESLDENFDPIKYFSQFKVGDYVVHKNHGIAIFQGIKKVSLSDGSSREYLVLSYAKGDKLYVPPDKSYLIQKYIGEEGYTPALNSLNSKAWQRTKEKIKKSVEVIARKLVELYARRMKAEGFPFTKNDGWLDELEASFPFEETPEQKQAIKEVYRDMEKDKPMDRLICGDVGFGKTEVAMRAAMKAVINGKQVAVLVPTTILARQHFLTFSERFHQFPIEIDYLNRFRSRKEQKLILQKLHNGQIDIIIGTHRLLSKDVKFNDLGLLIIDEEHRFGVKQKEKIRELRANVDTLALSATPIPRTLNMALSGIRDLSIIMNPPRGRKPVITQVHPYDEELIREACERELERGGQIFFLSNRIGDLKHYASVLTRLLPEAKVEIAHGRLEEKELEQVYLDFLDRKIDILVTTAIIESGLDIPNCNTIIVNNSHQLGLSQMYQLKGRVGRSQSQAYAYFLYPPHVIHNPIVRKRLEAIEEFKNLGDGFKIAMRDMELRGAGTLLGYEQSGHLLSVGFEMYYEILKETIEELKSQDGWEKKRIETEIELEVSAFIPDYYIYDFSAKIEWYKKISSVKQEEFLQKLKGEMEDKFGKIPLEVDYLYQIMELKLKAQRRQIEKIYYKNNFLNFLFSEEFEIKPMEISTLQRIPEFFQIKGREMRFKLGKKTTRQQLQVSFKILNVFEERI